MPVAPNFVQQMICRTKILIIQSEFLCDRSSVVQNLVRWVLIIVRIFANWSATIARYFGQHTPTMREDHQQPPPPPPQQHTTPTQHKNKIKHVFEIANLGFFNFNSWFWRSWLLLDVILVDLMLLNVTLMRLVVDDELQFCSMVLAIGEKFEWVQRFWWDWVRLTGIIWSKTLLFG